MAFLVYQTSKKTGTVYAYEAVSYRDPETGRPKSKRTYLGRVDPSTGEIVRKAEPGKRNRSKLGTLGGSAPLNGSSFSDASDPTSVGKAEGQHDGSMAEESYLIEKLRERIDCLEAELKDSRRQVRELEKTLVQIGSILQKHKVEEKQGEQ